MENNYSKENIEKNLALIEEEMASWPDWKIASMRMEYEPPSAERFFDRVMQRKANRKNVERVLTVSYDDYSGDMPAMAIFETVRGKINMLNAFVGDKAKTLYATLVGEDNKM